MQKHKQLRLAGSVHLLPRVVLITIIVLPAGYHVFSQYKFIKGKTLIYAFTLFIYSLERRKRAPHRCSANCFETWPSRNRFTYSVRYNGQILHGTQNKKLGDLNFLILLASFNHRDILQSAMSSIDTLPKKRCRSNNECVH